MSVKVLRNRDDKSMCLLMPAVSTTEICDDVNSILKEFKKSMPTLASKKVVQEIIGPEDSNVKLQSPLIVVFVKA
jgi:hypothetical protein